MNILIVGSGAREHAMAAAFARSSQSPSIFCYGSFTNPGISCLASGYHVGDIDDVAAVTQMAQQWQIDFAIIGPESPLEKGLTDALNAVGIGVIGPKKQLAQIETSKRFARDLMQKYQIAGLPRYRAFSSIDGVQEFLNTLGKNQYVIKANGLMGGKGVKVAGEHLHSDKEALDFCQTIFALGQTLIVEERLIGQEFSFMCFSDGTQVVPMPLVQDHKRAFVQDKGPNTGGMGSYSDVNHGLPFLTRDEVAAANTINHAVLKALSQAFNEKYIGILYGSFIATRHGVYVIEFNARFGDPEALNVLSILTTDFVTICQKMLSGNLTLEDVKFAHKATVCKYAVPEGYPDAPLRNVPISIEAVCDPTHLYLGAVNAIDGRLVATGSRTAAFVGIADTIYAAEMIAEKEICGVTGLLFHREDIGTSHLIESKIVDMQALRSQ